MKFARFWYLAPCANIYLILMSTPLVKHVDHAMFVALFLRELSTRKLKNSQDKDIIVGEKIRTRQPAASVQQCVSLEKRVSESKGA